MAAVIGHSGRPLPAKKHGLGECGGWGGKWLGGVQGVYKENTGVAGGLIERDAGLLLASHYQLALAR